MQAYQLNISFVFCKTCVVKNQRLVNLTFLLRISLFKWRSNPASRRVHSTPEVTLAGLFPGDIESALEDLDLPVTPRRLAYSGDEKIALAPFTH